MAYEKDTVVIVEYDKLKRIYKNADKTKLELVDDLLHKAAFLKVELGHLEWQVRTYGTTQVSNKGNMRVATAYKAFLQTLPVYQNVIKSIAKIMEESDNENDDAFDDFMKKAEGA